MSENDMIQNILSPARTAESVAYIASNLRLDATGPEKEMAKRIVKALQKPALAQGLGHSDLKHLRG
jgi:hypothetical protein